MLNFAPQTSHREANTRLNWTSSFRAQGALHSKRSYSLLLGVLLCSTLLPANWWDHRHTGSVAAEATTLPGEKSSTAPDSPTLDQNQKETPCDPATCKDAACADKTSCKAAAAADPVCNATGCGPALTEEGVLEPAVKTLSLTITVIQNGKENKHEVEIPAGSTVGDALRLLDIIPTANQTVMPGLDTSLYNNIRIRLASTGVQVRKRQQSVAFTRRFRPTTSLRRGTTKTLQAGQKGVLEITEKVWLQDGRPMRRQELSRRLVRQPRPEVVGLGTRAHYMPGAIPYHRRYARGYALAARGGSPRDRMAAQQAFERGPDGRTYRKIKSLDLVATGYSPDPRENGGYTTTATGLPIGYGAAAVDPKVIPLGTKLLVEGYGYAFACDTGGAIKGHRIDLAYDSYRLANTKGRKKVKVWILGD